MESDSYKDNKIKLVGDLRNLLKEVSGFSDTNTLAAIARAIDSAESDLSRATFPLRKSSEFEQMDTGIRNRLIHDRVLSKGLSLFSDGHLEQMS